MSPSQGTTSLTTTLFCPPPSPSSAPAPPPPPPPRSTSSTPSSFCLARRSVSHSSLLRRTCLRRGTGDGSARSVERTPRWKPYSDVSGRWRYACGTGTSIVGRLDGATRCVTGVDQAEVRGRSATETHLFALVGGAHDGICGAQRVHDARALVNVVREGRVVVVEVRQEDVGVEGRFGKEDLRGVWGEGV